MSKTWKDMANAEQARLNVLKAKLRRALAYEKAKNEVLMQIAGGKLKAKQIQGNTYCGKVPGMDRAIRFDLNELIRLRAESLLEAES